MREQSIVKGCNKNGQTCELNKVKSNKWFSKKGIDSCQEIKKNKTCNLSLSNRNDSQCRLLQRLLQHVEEQLNQRLLMIRVKEVKMLSDFIHSRRVNLNINLNINTQLTCSVDMDSTCLMIFLSKQKGISTILLFTYFRAKRVEIHCQITWQVWMHSRHPISEIPDKKFQMSCSLRFRIKQSDESLVAKKGDHLHEEIIFYFFLLFWNGNKHLVN